MSFIAATILFFSIFVTGLSGCTQVDQPKPQAVQYGGVCSEDYSKAYEKILNLDEESSELSAQCDLFYTKYPGVKCFSHVDGTELRIHTADFDSKCNRDLVKSKSTGSNGRDSRNQGPNRNLSLCSSELIDFITSKKTEFHSTIKSIEESSDNSIFEAALTSKKACNQYFFNYKYTQCSRDGYAYSFHDLKPYCDEFQNLLHSLKEKNPKKFSPQELKPLTTASLKFHFQDSLLPFYPAKLKVKDWYLADGKLFAFNDISSNQTYCFFESEKTKFAGELKNEIYKVDISRSNKNRTVFNYMAFNEQWRMVCHSRNTLYQQDLLEAVGDKISVFE